MDNIVMAAGILSGFTAVFISKVIKRNKIKKTAERYTPSIHKDDIYYEHTQRYFFAKNFIYGKDVLDVACGSGYGSFFLAKHGARRISGIDISEEAVDYCKKRYRRNNLSFDVMDAVNLGFPDDSFNVIISFETIEHIENYNLFLSELKRVLRPGGIIIISTPNKAVYGELKGDAHKFHIKEFYLGEFKELIGGYFNIRKIYGQRGPGGDLAVSESRVEESKFFICVGQK